MHTHARACNLCLRAVKSRITSRKCYDLLHNLEFHPQFSNFNTRKTLLYRCTFNAQLCTEGLGLHFKWKLHETYLALFKKASKASLTGRTLPSQSDNRQCPMILLATPSNTFSFTSSFFCDPTCVPREFFLILSQDKWTWNIWCSHYKSGNQVLINSKEKRACKGIPSKMHNRAINSNGVTKYPSN